PRDRHRDRDRRARSRREGDHRALELRARVRAGPPRDGGVELARPFAARSGAHDRAADPLRDRLGRGDHAARAALVPPHDQEARADALTLRRRRRSSAMPAIPPPSSSSVAGSGTGASLPLPASSPSPPPAPPPSPPPGGLSSPPPGSTGGAAASLPDACEWLERLQPVATSEA